MRATSSGRWFLAFALVAGLARADEAPVVDERASAFACTAQTLGDQRKCYLEGEVLPSHDAAAQAKANAAEAALLAPRACALAAKVNGGTDADLRAACEKEFQAAAQESCTLDGETPLFDEKGRFSPKSRDCYDALGQVVRRTRTMAATTVSCCRCLAKKCTAAPKDTCHHDLFEGDASAEAKACFARNTCVNECERFAGLPQVKIPEGATYDPTRADESPKPQKASAPPRKWY